MPKKVIGLDAGSTGLKLVELECSFRSHEIIRGLRAAASAENGDLASLVEKAYGGEELEGEVLTSIPLSEVTSRLLTLPFTSASKIDKVIAFELEESIPFSAEEMVVDHQTVEQDKVSSYLLAAGAKRERVAARMESLSKAGLNPRALMPEGYAFRSLAKFLQAEPGPYAFLNLGASHTVFTAGIGNCALAGRSITAGGNDVTKHLAQRLSISNDKAEQLKVSGEAHSGDLSAAAKEAFRPLAIQVKNSLRYLRAERGLSFSKIYLCGGAAKMQNIDAILTELIGVQCEVPSLPQGVAGAIGIEDAHALALALEDVNPVHGINLRKGELAYRSESIVFREKIAFPAVLLLIIVVLMSVNSLIRNRIREQELANLKARINSITEALMPGKDVSPARAAEELRSEIERMQKLEESIGKLTGVTPMQILTGVSQNVPSDISMDLEVVNITDKSAALEGVIQEHSDMDKIVDGLKKFSAFKRFDTPDLRPKVGGGVKFTLRIYLTEEVEEGDE